MKKPTLIQINKLTELHNGANILFCKTDYLSQAAPVLEELPRPCVLITGNSDLPVTDEMVEEMPDCIVHWFAQNADTSSSKVEGIPIGIENSQESSMEGHGNSPFRKIHSLQSTLEDSIGDYYWGHSLDKVEALSNFKDNKKPTNEVYANFSLENHISRKYIAETCESLGYVKTDITKNSFEINLRSYREYVENILDSKMVVSPRGAGIDCHRVWEVLYLGRVPIIKKENAMRYFDSLPIIMLDDWAQLESLDLLQEKYEEVKDNDTNLLDLDYWINKIKNAAELDNI